MPTDSSISVKNAKEKGNNLTEISNAEKQLWAHIQSKGVLGTDVRDLYFKACCIYEKLFLSEDELLNLQNIEYLLWRLHYKHIDEFRRRISQSSAKGKDKLSADKVDKYVEGFKLFLSEATKFYQDLIRKIKSHYGLVDEPWFYKNARLSGPVEQTKLCKCQFVCHRLCICLGDLARYLELYEKPDDQQRNWSVAAYFYLESAKIYPDGGNPHNQLAVLATYIEDEFLALYHCIRSLAVKEPFPDALQNLMLLFERNRSSSIGSLSNEAYDFSKPSEWISGLGEATTNGGYSNKTTLKAAEHDQSLPTDLWSLIIRMTSFFFMESSLDSFRCIFMSTLRELEALLALDVVKLSSSLESYKKMNLSKAGPYRVLHLISVLLFIIHNLNEVPKQKILKPTNENHQSMLVNLALTITFICMGRLVDRCLKGSPVVYFPLLPALLVFVEWLIDALDKVDVNDENCESSMRYFFGSFVELLNYLQENSAEIPFPDHIALWEDYELRGFVPLSHTHVSLDFSSHWEDEINYKMKSDHRARRIVQAAIKIVKKTSCNTQKWVSYDELGRKFRTVEITQSVSSENSQKQKSSSDFETKGAQKWINSTISSIVEEEEDIVFKPIVRHNSEPIPSSTADMASASDECLRRASSVLVVQDRSANDPHLKGLLPSTSSESPVAAGPPSLSSWVLNGENLPNERTKKREVNRSKLEPIEEMVSEELGGLALSKDESFIVSSLVTSPSTYCVPVPSAPLLPENAVWYTGSSRGFSLNNAATHQPASYFPVSEVGISSHPSYVHQTGFGVPTLFDYSPPNLAPVEYYPWTGPQFPKPGYSHVVQEQNYAARNLNGVYGSEASTFELLDGYNNLLASSPTIWFEGSPPPLPPSSFLLHGLYDQRRDMLFQGSQRASPYVSHTATVTKPNPQPLLLHLKQKELRHQQESQFTGSPYMQN